MATQDNCCNHGVAPFGLAFRIPGIEACNECPVGKTLELMMASNTEV